MSPRYDLEKVISAASRGDIIYAGRKVARDIANLDYTFNDVITCIKRLELKHYQKTWISEDNTALFDVYLIEYSINKNKKDTIYIKVRLLENDKIFLFLGSFHLS